MTCELKNVESYQKQLPYQLKEKNTYIMIQKCKKKQLFLRVGIFVGEALGARVGLGVGLRVGCSVSESKTKKY